MLFAFTDCSLAGILFCCLYILWFVGFHHTFDMDRKNKLKPRAWAIKGFLPGDRCLNLNFFRLCNAVCQVEKSRLYFSFQLLNPIPLYGIIYSLFSYLVQYQASHPYILGK